MKASQYLHSGKVGHVLIHEEDKYIFLKANVNPSQASCPAHSALVMVTAQGAVEMTDCSCIADLGRSCSHTTAILWKVSLSTACYVDVHNSVMAQKC